MLFDQFENLFKGIRVFLSEGGEDLPVETDVRLLQGRDEAGVGSALSLEESVHADSPETAEVTLLVAAVSEGVLTSVRDSLIRHLLLGGAAEAVTLYGAKHVAPRL